MTKPLANKVALVTGGGRGIGKAIAERLADDGAYVYINYRSNKKAAEKVVQSIKNKKGMARTVQADLGNVKEIENMIGTIQKEHAQLHILVNNAGIFAMTAVENVEEKAFEDIININMKGPLFATKQALPLMKSGGVIIYISSSITEFPTTEGSVYTATKMALRGYAMAQSQEFGKRGITVNCVLPGPTESDMFDNVSEDYKKVLIEASPLKRIGKPEEIAGVVAFLAGKDGAWINGQSILVNGGAIH